MIEDGATVLHLANAGESVILDIDIVILITSSRSAQPRSFAIRHGLPWLPANGDAPPSRRLVSVPFDEAKLLLQCRDARGKNYAQMQFYAVAESGEIEASLYPSGGESRSARIEIGRLSDVDLTGEKVDGYSLTGFGRQLREAVRDLRDAPTRTGLGEA